MSLFVNPHFGKQIPLLFVCGGKLQRKIEVVRDVVGRLAKNNIKTVIVYSPEMGHECKSLEGTLNSIKSDVIIIRQKISTEGADEEKEDIHGMFIPLIDRYDLIISFARGIGEIPGSNSLLLYESVESTGDAHFCHRIGDEIDQLEKQISVWLEALITAQPVWGCVLIGGQSSRMGQPKHLLQAKNGRTWVENQVAVLAEITDQVVLAGAGEVPESLLHVPRVTDIPAAKGPIAGLLGAMRWNPYVSWIFSACDMPLVQHDAINWLLSQRKPGIWGTVPLHPRSQIYEPLLAFYDFRSRSLFEKILSTGNLRLQGICDDDKISTPIIPHHFITSWQNCNTPDDLNKLNSRSSLK